MLNSFRSALSFLTLLPVGKPTFDVASSGWFWFAGAVIALVELLVLVGSRLIMSRLDSAIIAVIVDGILTRGLHYDAVSDFADGFFAPLPKEKRLDVMEDSRVGAFGVMGLIGIVLLRVSALATLSNPAVAVLVPIMIMSRSFMSFALWLLPSAKKNGFVVHFQYDETGSRRVYPSFVIVLMVVGVFVSLTVGYLGFGVRSLIVPVGELAVFASIMYWSIRSIDGVTGDVLGAGGLLAETLSLILAAVVLK